MTGVKLMDNIDKALRGIERSSMARESGKTMPFSEFMALLSQNPSGGARNIFQLFHDMVKSHIDGGDDEYEGDPESINFLHYDCRRLFVEDSDHPFFADRLFANRFIRQVEAFKRGGQQNKIYIFEGPHGSGKSTFLNNLLLKFEQYVNTPEGTTFETVWRLDRKLLDRYAEKETILAVEKLLSLLESPAASKDQLVEAQKEVHSTEAYLEVPCPSHDHPLLQIPKEHRRKFLDDLFKNDESKWKLFTEKEYEWLFKYTPCTICTSLYQALNGRLRSPSKVLAMLYARPYQFDRRLGEGISVFNPGDRPTKSYVLTNEILQGRINALLRDSNLVKYLFSRYAKTNNGIYALMDIKSYNTERIIELHNIISEGVHKVEDLEENVNSLFLALMNPEDKKNIEEFQSFSDRIEYIHIPYVMDLSTEVEIYHNIFGRHITQAFLPRVLNNFARVIISTRLDEKSDALLEWIGNPDKYSLYCDKNLHLLKMEIYRGHIPEWLTEEDRKRLNAKRRRSIIGESDKEGWRGFSGRDSIRLFNEFYTSVARKDRLINMMNLHGFFKKLSPDIARLIPEGFLESLMQMYNFSILQEVKESLYYFNEAQISRDIQNYLFAINFEPGSVQTCHYTRDRFEITEDFLASIERRLLGPQAGTDMRREFRRDVQKQYTARTLTQEMMVEQRAMEDTELFHALHERYVFNLKEKVLDPFLENENFRNAIRDFNKEEFKTYDKRIRDDVSFLMSNLCQNFKYTKRGAQEVCIYVIDQDLAKKFSRR